MTEQSEEQCLLTGAVLWDACERAGRAKRHLGSEYEIVTIESLPHHRVPGFGFETVRMTLGERLRRANGKTVWVGLRKCTVTAREVNDAAVAHLEAQHEKGA